MSRHGENIRKRKDGRWEARYIQGYDQNGKAKYRYIYGKTYLDVKKKRQDELIENKRTINQCNSGQTNVTFRIVCDEWLSEKKIHIKESTYVIYLNLINTHILPVLGSHLMRTITQDTIQQFLMDKRNNGRLDGTGGLSNKTVSDIYSILKQVLHYAQSHGFPELAQIQLVPVGSRQPKIQVLTLTEQKKLEYILYTDPRPLHLGILLSLYTGIRIGEICALKWGDFDFENATVSINKTLLRIQDHNFGASSKTKVIIETPKTPCSIRTIPLPDFLLDYYKENQQSESCYVLTGTTCYMEPRVCLEKYKIVLKQIGLPSYTFHVLRHTFATRGVEQGMDIKTLSEIMGHSNVSITMQRYVHPSLEMKREQINKLSGVTICGRNCGQNY